MTPVVCVSQTEPAVSGEEGDNGSSPALRLLAETCGRAGARLLLLSEDPRQDALSTGADLPGVTRIAAGMIPGRISSTHSEDPGCLCGFCRVRNSVIASTADDEPILLVGSRAEDLILARCADVVFARGALQSACQAGNITYLPFATPVDATSALDAVLRRGRIPRRWMAAQHRRALFMAEA